MAASNSRTAGMKKKNRKATRSLHGENWRVIEGLEGFYSVSDRGRVRSEERNILRRHGEGYRVSQKILRPGKSKDGRLSVVLYRDGRKKTVYIARLVAQEFISPPPPGLEACHNDGNPSNNVPSNLRYDTHAGNMADTIRHGRSTRGEKQGGAKLTADQVAMIRSDQRFQRVIAKEFGISRTNVSHIKLGHTWGHV